MPSSSSVAHTSVGETSTNRSLCSASRMACRSASVSARGCGGPGAGSGRAAAVGGSGGAAGSSRPAPRRGPRRPRGRRSRVPARRSRRRSRRRRRLGVPPSESVSKSACSFACTSTTKRALASSCSSRCFSPAKQRSVRRAGRGVYGHEVRPTRPTRRRHGPAATPRCGWSTGPRDAAGHPSRHRRRVVGGQDLQLVLRGERAPTGALGHLRVRPLRPGTPGHPPAQDHRSRSLDQPGQLACHVGEAPSPPSGH